MYHSAGFRGEHVLVQRCYRVTVLLPHEQSLADREHRNP